MSPVEPLVTICIPAFNSEKWIAQTIQSAVSQTWPRKEIIVVDDGSEDRTCQIISQYESNNVRLITQENKGACAARNTALNYAKGDFIQWLDADDILAPDKIEKQLLASDQNPASMILHSCSWGHFYYCLSRAKFIVSPLWQDMSSLNWLLISFRTRYMMPTHAWLVSRRITNLAGLWNEKVKVNQDGEYFCRVVGISNYVKFHPDSACYYRKGNAESISEKNRSISERSYANNLCVDALLKFQNSEVTRGAAASFLNDFISVHDNKKSAIIVENKKRVLKLGGINEQSDQSKRFILMKRIFGYRAAQYIKTVTWRYKVSFEKRIDKTLSLLGRE